MIRFFKRADWRQHARPRAEAKDDRVNEASRPCPRCCATARAIEYVRHQWIAAGIDWE